MNLAITEIPAINRSKNFPKYHPNPQFRAVKLQLPGLGLKMSLPKLRNQNFLSCFVGEE